MVEKISVQIALEGTEQIKRDLAGVSEAGQKCFEDISAAAAKAGGFDKLDPTLVARKFNQFGITATNDINKITNALKAAGRTEAMVTGIQKMERGTQQLGNAANRATAAFGLTRREIGAIGKVLRELNLGALGGELGLIGRVGGAFGPAGIAISAVAIAIGGITAALVKFASVAGETEKALTELQKVSGASFENLSAMQQVFAAGGTPLKKFADEFGNLSEKIADAGQQKGIRDASADTVKWANDIRNVRNQFDSLARGAGGGFPRMVTDLTTLDNKVKGLLESLARVKDPQEQWLKLADIFKNLGSDMARAQLGKALGLSPESIRTLTQGSEAIKQMQAEAQRLGLTLTTSNQQALQQMAQGWNQFTTFLSAAFQKIGVAATPAFTQILAIANQTLAQIVQDFQNLRLDQAIANLGNRLGPAFEAISTILSPIMTQIGNALGAALMAGINAAIDVGIQYIVDRLKRELLQAYEVIKRGLGISPGGGGSEAAPAAGFASGGLIGGRGSGTSDSNLAWVSRGEHIMPARAVGQPGVLAFLEALRRTGGDLSRVLDGMGRFALGGLVPRSIPAFASGGPVGSMSNVTIQFPGLPDIGGLRASTSTIDELRRAAALAQVRSGGRKPSRYS